MQWQVGLVGVYTLELYLISSFQDYLAKYGYLKQSDAKSGNLLSDDYVKQAVSQFQRMAGLPITGT